MSFIPKYFGGTMNYEIQVHPFGPLYDQNSKILILGSFPSVKSREQTFFYAHKQNRFWKVLAAITEYANPLITDEDKRTMLLESKVALWDTIASCEIKGSSDSSITKVVPNDLNQILIEASIKKIFCNGTTAYNLYKKHENKDLGIEAIKLPSTSPANAAWSLESLVETWKKEISPYLSH